MVVRLNVHTENKDGEEQVESVSRVLPGRYSVLNLSPKVRCCVCSLAGQLLYNS